MNPMRVIKINFLTHQENERMMGPVIRRFRRLDHIPAISQLEIMLQKVYGKGAWFLVDTGKPQDASTWYGSVYKTICHPGARSSIWRLVSGDIRVDFS